MAIIVSPRPVHYVLVDYDNLIKNISLPIVNVVPYICKTLDNHTDFFARVKLLQRIKVFLYGGWYVSNRLTSMAQDVIKDINAPSEYKKYKSRSGVDMTIEISLALRMLSIDKPLFGTYRKYAQRDAGFQKLVDAMLACDMQWLSDGDKENRVALVSRDDDLIPPLFQQTTKANNVYHVLTSEESDHCYENFYYPIRPKMYRNCFLQIGA